ncbi:hypothetical protein Bca4012_020074 [Brassica carinata]
MYKDPCLFAILTSVNRGLLLENTLISLPPTRIRSQSVCALRDAPWIIPLRFPPPIRKRECQNPNFVKQVW